LYWYNELYRSENFKLSFRRLSVAKTDVEVAKQSQPKPRDFCLRRNRRRRSTVSNSQYIDIIFIIHPCPRHTAKVNAFYSFCYGAVV